MRRLGKVLHQSPSGNAIVKVENIPKIGDTVVDEKLRHIGTIADVFGPVSSPYAAVRIKLSKPGKLHDKTLYVSTHGRSRARARAR